jgi:hypothetical protein
MFLLAIKARIIACAMKILGLEKINSRPTAYLYLKDKSRCDKTTKWVYIRNLAAQIVDKFIVDEKLYNRVVQHVLEEHRNKHARQLQVNVRFPCRKSGCNKTFRFAIKRVYNVHAVRILCEILYFLQVNILKACTVIEEIEMSLCIAPMKIYLIYPL